MEIYSYPGEEDRDEMMLAEFMKTHKVLIKDAVVTQTDEQVKEIKALREQIRKSCGKIGKSLKYEVQVDPSVFYKIINSVREFVGHHKELSLQDKSRVIPLGYGSIGTGQLRIIIFC